MEPNQANASTARPSIKKLGGLALGLAHSHLELFSIEYQEEKARLLKLFISAALLLFFVLLLLISLSCLTLLLFWESHRLWVAGGLCGLYALGLILTAAYMQRLLSQSAPFQDSLNELKKAREQLLP